MEQIQYNSGNASLFAAAARQPSIIYVLHRDHASGGWNVFKKTGLCEEFIKGFEDLKTAQDFCDQMNNS